jgi:hypothetical protein
LRGLGWAGGEPVRYEFDGGALFHAASVSRVFAGASWVIGAWVIGAWVIGATKK